MPLRIVALKGEFILQFSDVNDPKSTWTGA